jgi:acetate kinase
MHVLVVNAGSSSLKLSTFHGGDRADSLTVERWSGGKLEPIESFVRGQPSIDAVGHRVVHGGSDLTASVRIDDDVIATIEGLSDLAPLHNPPAAAGMRDVGRLLPEVPAVACFDTAFHAGLPMSARTYALPREWNARWGLRRFGFHGLSHAYAVRRAAEIVGRKGEDLRIVSCHLGAGASLAAVVDGRSVDTTMGFTPLEGLVMLSRAGSVDPGLLLWLVNQRGVKPEHLASVLIHESGLKGLSGTSGDLRDVLAGRAQGDADCGLAFDVFVHRLRREIGAMTASAGGLDLLVFTGGMGEHVPDLRSAVAAGLGYLGVVLDPSANAAAAADADVTGQGATVSSVVVTAAEDSEIALETHRLLSKPPAG